MPIEVLRHFSVPIYSVLLEGFADRRASLIETLRAIRDEGPGVSLTNRRSFHSHADLHERSGRDLEWMRSKIVEFATGALGELYGSFKSSEARIVECWTVIGGPGAWHTPHHHFPRAWSGVLYVSAEHCVSKTDAADRSGKIEFLNPIPTAPAFFSPPSVAYGPKDGLVLLFPGALTHMVHPNPTDDERIIVSFNLEIVKKMDPSAAKSG